MSRRISSKLCAVAGCGRPLRFWGLCNMHAQRKAKYGTTDLPKLHPSKTPLAERISSKCKVDGNGCWVWQGAADRKGYGIMMVRLKRVFAHRVSYEAFRGSIPTGLVIDHLCRNPPCCNPDHLEPVTQRENTLRGINPPALAARATHCKQGHPYTGENLFFGSDGSRRCRICTRAANAKTTVRRKAARVAAVIAATMITASCATCDRHPVVCTAVIASVALSVPHLGHHHTGSSGTDGRDVEVPRVDCTGSACR